MHEPSVRQPTPTAISALVGAVACVAVLSCGGGDGGHLGRLMMAFSIEGGIVVDAVSFTVTSSVGTILASGTIDTHDASGTVSIATACAASAGDTATLVGIARDGRVCAGASAPFEVRIGLPVVVDVILVCGQPSSPSTKGSVVVQATVVAGNNCPLLTSWTVAPLRISPFGAISAAAAATDGDSGDHLTFSWASASGGTFSAPNAPFTSYSCPATTGILADTLTVVVSDNHAPAPCMAGVSVPVTCVALDDAGADSAPFASSD